MKLRWLNKIKKEDEKELVKRQIKEAKPVLDRLAVIIQEDLDRSIGEMSQRKHFQSSWEYKMSHYLGEQAALRSILEYLKIEDK